ncbi:putative coatomer subunit alpha [Elsinoe australis]|uniref:Putative coatomer subunit alpha n=1 Tax=Elsinoe australis TaxID=40998 RepID=A0A4U7B368_9PEZI|nr:putative coatomer subunit alpha [Elsinoe australis]
MQSSPTMLTKFESKSSRAKGIAFHPKRPWILVSLHSSTIQLWDYRMGTLIDRFEEHDGPVRGIDFHKTQPLFVSGGDDYKIKVWSYQTRRCLFTLSGHLDYVRTVFFHHELPWIISSSDDQTIKIWNWQNRSLICTMTGHNHYAMCAQFHPKEDLVVSASLDQSVRVWDISGLRKKHSAPQTMTFEDQMARANANQADMFGNTDAVVKFVLEGHDRGVNWVSFHPTLPLIVSAGDDRLIKLWRMSETKAWEVDTCRGHFQNASACVFHPHQDLILSVGEDKTVRVWDLNKRTSVQSFKRENDRFWVIAAHPEINLFAAGHDNGVMVFKLERERPASAVYQNQLFYITKEKHVRAFDFTKNVESPSMLSLKKLGSAWVPPRSMSYNPAERAILVTSPVDGGVYELVSLPKDANGAVEPTNTMRGSGQSAVFVARNRFAVFNSANQQVDIKDLSNSTTKTIKPPHGTTDIFFGGTGCLLLVTPTTVYLYDIQQKKQLAELAVAGVKYVTWSSDGLHCALLSKHNVTIVTKQLEQVSTLHETIRIKSAVWDDAGVLLYSTLNHIKYTLMNGDNGIVRTLDQTVYLVRVKGRSVYALDRAAKPKIMTIEPTEYRFKLALVKRQYDEMLNIIKTSSLVGQSIISYLQKKGYPEIALQFVQDPQTRFELAIECGNLDVAVEMAKQLDRPKIWQQLSSEAMAHGNHQVVEMTYQKLKSFDKLSFLYLATGDENKLQRMAKIAEHRGDMTSRFQNSVYLNDVQSRIEMLKEIDQYPLAYLAAKTHGLEDECQAILDATGLTEDQISLPTIGKPLTPPSVVVPTYQANWPVKSTGVSSFEKALLAEGGDEEAVGNGFADEDFADAEAEPEANGHLEEAEDEDAAGWDMGEETVVSNDDDYVNVEADEAGAGISEAEVWIRNSPVAADHVAGGSFETAMNLLNRQVGAVNFKPLESRFYEIHQAVRTYLPASPGLPPLVNYVRRTLKETESRKILPFITRDLESLTTTELSAGKQRMQKNQLEEGVAIFKKILHTMLVNAVASKSEVEEAKTLIQTAASYTLAMSIELTRRSIAGAATDLSSLPEDQRKRVLELSAYFTVPPMDPNHVTLALYAAMNLANRNKQLSSALGFANALLEKGTNAKFKEQAKKVKTACERSPGDTIEVEFDPFAEFEVCGASYTPIYAGEQSVSCPYDGTKYQMKYKGTLNGRFDACIRIGQARKSPKPPIFQNIRKPSLTTNTPAQRRAPQQPTGHARAIIKKSEGTILDRVKRLERHVSSPNPLSPGEDEASASVGSSSQHVSPDAQYGTPVSPVARGQAVVMTHGGMRLPPIHHRTSSVLAELPRSIPRDLAEKWMKSALSDSIHDKFLGLVDLKALEPIPAIIDSAYARVDPAVATIYYFLINIGWHQDVSAEPYWGSVIYNLCIRDLPDWDHMETYSDLDLAAVTVTIYIAQEKFDMRMAWKLFLQSKRIVDGLGIRELDAKSLPAEATPDERNEARRLAFGQLMRIDCLFRAFYGKPPVFMNEPWSVHLPSVVINRAADPSEMGLATVLVAFARLMLVIMESFRVLDDDDMCHRDIRSRLEGYFWQAHTWLEEWQIEDAFRRSTNPSEKRLFGDTLLFAFSLLVVWETKMRGSRDLTRVVARESARKIVRVFLELAQMDAARGSRSCRSALSVTGSTSFAGFFYLLRLANADESENGKKDLLLLEEFTDHILRGCQTYGYSRLLPLAEYMYRVTREPEMGIEPGIAGVPDVARMQDWNAAYTL